MLSGKVLAVGAFKKLPSSESASLELQGIIERLDLLQNISCQVVHEFGDVSRSTEGIKFTIKKVILCLRS